MKRPLCYLGLAALFTALGQPTQALGQAPAKAGVRTDPENPRYTYRTRHSRDGIGKFYMGREIAHVMGHLGAGWLERPSRELEEKPQTLIRALKIKPGDNVADIGVGTGYFARRIARVIGPKGTVYGVDIQPEMLELLKKNLDQLGIKNVKGVLGSIQDPKLPPNRPGVYRISNSTESDASSYVTSVSVDCPPKSIAPTYGAPPSRRYATTKAVI